MDKTDSTNAKIIILYILSKVDDISSSQLMDCCRKRDPREAPTICPSGYPRLSVFRVP